MADNDLGLRYWLGNRVTRRRLLGGVAVGGATVAAIGLVGCSDTTKPPASSTAGATRTPRAATDGTQDGTPTHLGGILRVRQNPALPSLNVFGPGILTLVQGLYLGYTMYDHMWFVPTDTGVIELFLATSVEQPDPLTVIAKLGDATFHDKAPVNGRKVMASDIEASFKRFREEIGIGYDWLHNVMADISGDDSTQTVKVTQNQPWAWVYTSSNAGSPITSSILPKEILHDHDDLLRSDVIGSGQWVLQSHDNGANLRLRKFDKFRQFAGTKSIAGQPYLDGVDLNLITDDNQALAAFKAGQIDTLGFANKDDAESTQSDMGDKVVVTSDLGRDYDCLMMIYEDPFKDERVRHAINLLIDRDEAINLLEQGSGVKCGPLPPAHSRYVLPDDDQDLQEYFRHDIAEAKKLLDAAGFDYNQTIQLKHSNRPDDANLAEVLQQQLAQGGVKVSLEQEDLIRWLTTSLNQSQFQMTCFRQLPYEDPDLPLRFYLGPEGDRTNFMKYKDPAVDAAVLAAARELDPDERIKKVQDAQRTIIKAWSPMLNIYSPIGYGGRYSYVKGSISGRGSYGLFNRTLWLDKS